MNVNIKTREVKDGLWGSMTAGDWDDPSTQVWDGVVGELMREEADTSFTDIAICPERLAVIDILHAVTELEYTLSIRGKRIWKFGQFLNFGKSFTIEGWLGVLSFSIAIGLLICLVFDATPLDAFTGIIYLTFQQSPMLDLHRFPLTRKAVILVASLFFACLFVHFNANLTSLMTTPKSNEELASYEDILKHGYSITTVGSTIQANLIKQALNRPNAPFHKISQAMERNNIKYLRSKKEYVDVSAAEKLAYLGSPFVEEPDITTILVKYPIRGKFSIGLRKDSEFTELFNHLIKKYQENGILEAIRRDAFNSRLATETSDENDQLETIEGDAPTLGDLRYGLLGTGYLLGLALALLLIEIVLAKCKLSANSAKKI